jgi:hypothetical protein
MADETGGCAGAATGRFRGNAARRGALTRIVLMAGEASRIAGITMTQEYSLHNLTRRMRAWTREYGTGARAAEDAGALGGRSWRRRLVAPDRLWRRGPLNRRSRVAC